MARNYLKARKEASKLSFHDAKNVGDTKKGTQVLQSLDPTQDILHIFSASSTDGFKEIFIHDNNSSQVIKSADPFLLKGNYVVLIFDCDSKLDDTADKKARMDYFNLMANLTSSADPSTPMQTVYIHGKGNKHVFEEPTLVKSVKEWKFLSSSKSGLKISNAVRAKYGVKDEELRIIVLDDNQNVISENALDLLRINPRGMPWVPNSLASIMQGSEVFSGGGSNSTEKLDVSSPLAIYFSASWCAPCKKFTPKLVSKYSSNATDSIAKLGGMEVLFVSLDSEEDQFNSYRASMPWPAVPFRDPRRALLQMALGVKSIPALVLIDEKGHIVTSSGVTQLISDEKMERFPWGGDVVDLDAGNGALVEALQRGPALIALSSKEEKANMVSALGAASKSLKSEILLPRSPREDLIFCVADSSSKVASAIYSLCNYESKSPDTMIVLLDLAGEQYSAMPKTSHGDLQTAVVNFATKYKRYALPLSKISIPATETE
jgi:thiol-disulfide isomerase/thioredoxin